MLKDESFLLQSVTINLFYLTTFRAFCVNIGFSLLEKEKDLADIAKNFIEKADFLFEIVIGHAKNNLPKDVLDNNILVTKYTLQCEKLTEKLFGLTLYTDNTKKLMEITPGFSQNITNEDVNVLMNVNQKAFNLCNEFIIYLKDLFIKQTNNEIFSYSYPFLIKKMIESIQLYADVLNRLINKQDVDPTFIIDYEYRASNLMASFAQFIRNFLDPGRKDLFIKAQSFVVEFEALEDIYVKSTLSPESHATLVKKALNLIKRFANFISYIIDSMLKKEVYLIVAPIFIDDMYRAVNYYKYVVENFV